MTNRKSLPSTTIIPDDLYVEREADRQLDAVIEDMGRPGYILVARQMGKTNLLLRMKRVRESRGDLALYLDLSTSFDDARLLFHSIIDKIIEQVGDSVLEDKIIEDRAWANFDPNTEYDRHFRMLLEKIEDRRVIIILDEIDSLVGKSYSDRILAQIRSMYFARANYPVYNKATYVLSGVAEPTDLIKDRNVSPFNIGEKIYLSDFSLSEVGLLISKAGLSFSPDVIEEVFTWASGNPRMTWDICAALEDLQRAGEHISPSSVQATIQKLYLTRFDRAPLDHIRALAESEREVRDALITVLHGKGGTLDDRARSKLYLAGITTASANDAPQIKNRIIETALSEAWLSQVEAGRRGLLDAAAHRYRDKEYQRAVEMFEQYLSTEGTLEELSDFELMDYGLSHYGLSNFREADQILSLALSKTKTNELRNVLRFHLGITRLLSGDVSSALPLLEEAAKTPGAIRVQALHQVGSALALSAPLENTDRVIEIAKEVIAEANSNTDLTEDDAATLIVASHYNLSQIYRASNQAERSKEHILLATKANLAEKIPGIAFLFLDENLHPSDIRDAFELAANAVIRERPRYSTSPSSFAFKRLAMAALLNLALFFQEKELFDELLDIASSNSGENRFEALIELAKEASKPGQVTQLHGLVEYAIAEPSLLGIGTVPQKLEAYRYWLLTDPDQVLYEKIFEDYWEIVSNSENERHIIDDDFILLMYRFVALISEDRLEEASSLMEFVRQRANSIIEMSRMLFGIFVYHEMNLLNKTSDSRGAQSRARELLRLLEPAGLETDVIAKSMASSVEHLRQVARAAIRNHPPTISTRKYGRNELVRVRDTRTGIEIRLKYKKIADRLSLGDFELIEADENP